MDNYNFMVIKIKITMKECFTNLWSKRALWKLEIPLASRILVQSPDKIRRCRKALSKWKKKNSMNALDKIHQIQTTLEWEEFQMRPYFIRINTVKRNLLETYKKKILESKKQTKMAEGRWWKHHVLPCINQRKQIKEIPGNPYWWKRTWAKSRSIQGRSRFTLL